MKQGLTKKSRHFQRRCIYVYKCFNGLVVHDFDSKPQDIIQCFKATNTLHCTRAGEGLLSGMFGCACATTWTLYKLFSYTQILSLS